MKRGDLVMCRKVAVPDPFEVRIMAVADGYAMVRRKGAMPFVAALKDLSERPVA